MQGYSAPCCRQQCAAAATWPMRIAARRWSRLILVCLPACFCSLAISASACAIDVGGALICVARLNDNSNSSSRRRGGGGGGEIAHQLSRRLRISAVCCRAVDLQPIRATGGELQVRAGATSSAVCSAVSGRTVGGGMNRQRRGSLDSIRATRAARAIQNLETDRDTNQQQ